MGGSVDFVIVGAGIALVFQVRGAVLFVFNGLWEGPLISWLLGLG